MARIKEKRLDFSSHLLELKNVEVDKNELIELLHDELEMNKCKNCGTTEGHVVRIGRASNLKLCLKRNNNGIQLKGNNGIKCHIKYFGTLYWAISDDMYLDEYILIDEYKKYHEDSLPPTNSKINKRNRKSNRKSKNKSLNGVQTNSFGSETTSSDVPTIQIENKDQGIVYVICGKLASFDRKYVSPSELEVVRDEICSKIDVTLDINLEIKNQFKELEKKIMNKLRGKH